MVERFRKGYSLAMRPLAKIAVALHMTPDMVTWCGTLVTLAVALWLVPLGHLWQASLAITVCVLTDGIDGEMARMTGKTSSFGAFLDSTLDRVADGGIFGAVALYYAGLGHSVLWCGIAIGALVMGQVTSYTKARGLALGYDVFGGIAARGDRLLILLVGMLLGGLRLHWAMPVALCLLFAASSWTVGQRMFQVRTQAHAADAAGEKHVDPQAVGLAHHTAEREAARQARQAPSHGQPEV